MSLKGSKTEKNLKAAFAREAQANRRYVYFASKAEIEGYSDVAAAFRSTAEDETGHSSGHLEYLEECGDPITGLPFSSTLANLRSAIAGEIFEFETFYPEMEQQARDEGLDDIADWFATLAKSEKAHITRLKKFLERLESEES
ncbi:rubrerythrin [Chromatiales bacterium (ex Bugula neritina AB1)]|nr:rubrerythrin [Chromatiales bacterium (ex Bugula neritina AB1)]